MARARPQGPARQHAGQYDLHLIAGERCAEAVAHSATKREKCIGHKEKGTVTFSTSLWGLHPGSGLGAGARASTNSTADEIQSDPQTQMSTMFAWAGFRLGISYEAELRCLRLEIRTSGTRVLCGCTLLRLRIGGAVGHSSCCLPLVAGILDRGSSACDHGRTDSFFFLDLSVLSNPVPALGPAFRSHITRVRDSTSPCQASHVAGAHVLPSKPRERPRARFFREYGNFLVLPSWAPQRRLGGETR